MRKVISCLILALMITSVLSSRINIRTAKSIENDWWDAEWMYRIRVNLTENSGYSLVNFPVEVIFRHNSHAQLDGKDIRVIDGSMEIPSYVEECNNTYAKVVFEINLTAFQTKTLYIYYGNPHATPPNYPLVPLTILEGNNGYAIIDSLVYLGWKYTKWGWDYDNNAVVLWTDYKIDFDKNGDPMDNNDLITDVSGRIGGIGRYRLDYGNGTVRSIGLGDYQCFVQTPVYVDIIFANASLRVFRKQTFVQTCQADKLCMFGQSWDFAKYCDGIEEDIIDGLNTNEPGLFHVLYSSTKNPVWMAYKNSISGDILAASGFNISKDYMYRFIAKEASAWDRGIRFDFTTTQILEPHDQPAYCKIYWFGDNRNDYTGIERMAQAFYNHPSIIVGMEETQLPQAIKATVNIHPQILNLRSRGRCITAYIELPEGYDVNNINVSTIMLNDTVTAELRPIAIGDYDEDGILDLMVKFDRATVILYILINVNRTKLFEERFMTVILTITGYLNDGTSFQGSTTITVAMPILRYGICPI